MFRARCMSILAVCFAVVAMVMSPRIGPVSVAHASSAPDFTISANPTSQTIERGGTAKYTIDIGAVNGFTGTVTLTDTDPFAKTVASFHDLSGNQIFPPVTISGSGDIQFQVFSNGHQTPTGTQTLTVTGTSGSLQHSVQVSLTVIPVPNFSLFSNPFTGTVKPGGATEFQLRARTTSNFNGAVSLSLSGLPANATASFSPATVNVTASTDGNSVMDIQSTTQTPTGSFALTLTGTAPSVDPNGVPITLTNTLALTLEVIPPDSDFSISVSPTSQSIQMSLGVNAVYTVHVTAIKGFIGTVVFSATAAPSSSALAFFSPQTVTTSGDTDLLYEAGHSPLGTFTITVTATSGPLQHTTQVTCTVT